jgi:predicted transport protein
LLQVFRVTDGAVCRIEGGAVELERHLQVLIEANMPEMLQMRFLAHEYSTGPLHRGRIDTLALDEDGSPVIVEYKRTRTSSVLSQGLFYLAWLLENRAEFESLVVDRLGEDAGRTVDWSNPRVVCVATDYTRYDVVAAGMSHHRVDLLEYRQYARDLVTLDLVASVAGGCGTRTPHAGSPNRSEGTGRRGVRDLLDSASADLQSLFSDLEERLLDLGNGMCVELQHYWAFRRRRNFACVRLTRESLVVVLNVDPSTVRLESGWTRDLRGVGHLGTGDLEVRIASLDELERAEPLFAASFAAAA